MANKAIRLVAASENGYDIVVEDFPTTYMDFTNEEQDKFFESQARGICRLLYSFVPAKTFHKFCEMTGADPAKIAKIMKGRKRG